MKKKTKSKTPKLNSEAALKRALGGKAFLDLRIEWMPKTRDFILHLHDREGDCIWWDSLRRLGITKRKPLKKGVMKRLKKAVR